MLGPTACISRVVGETGGELNRVVSRSKRGAANFLTATQHPYPGTRPSHSKFYIFVQLFFCFFLIFFLKNTLPILYTFT